MANGEVLFVRNGKLGSDGHTSEDDMWDDTALLEAYEGAVNIAKTVVVQRMGLEPEDVLKETSAPKQATRRRAKKKKASSNLEWHVGGHCRAVYSLDGNIYEATILSIQPEAGTCVVRYVGYNNDEVVPLNQLLPSAGHAARIKQASEVSLDDPALENGLKMEYSDCEGSKGPTSARSSISRPQFKKQNRTSGRTGPYPQSSSNNFPPMGLPPMVIPPPPPPNLTSMLPDEDTEALSAMLLSWYMSGFHTGYYQGLQQSKKSHHHLTRNQSRKT